MQKLKLGAWAVYYLVFCYSAVNNLCSAQETPATLAQNHSDNWQQALWADGQLSPAVLSESGAFMVPAMGYLMMPDLPPADFVLEFDVQSPMMPGIIFRADSALQNYEYIYFRLYPGAASYETIQYIPTYHGEMSWQLYNAPYYEKGAQLPSDKPFHVKLVVMANNAALYLNNAASPDFVITPLLSGRKNGKLLFTSISKAFSVENIRFRPAEKTDQFVERQTLPQVTDGSLMHWTLSQQFDCDNSSFIYQTVKKLEEQGLNTSQQVTANNMGIVNLSQYYDVPGRWALASTELNAEQDQQVTLNFDYTHEIAIFVNGLPIFTGKEIDRENGNFGRVVPAEQNISLSLKKGSNKLTFAVHADDEMARYFKASRLGKYQARNWGFTASVKSSD